MSPILTNTKWLLIIRIISIYIYLSIISISIHHIYVRNPNPRSRGQCKLNANFHRSVELHFTPATLIVVLSRRWDLVAKFRLSKPEKNRNGWKYHNRKTSWDNFFRLLPLFWDLEVSRHLKLCGHWGHFAHREPCLGDRERELWSTLWFKPFHLFSAWS